jgi:hypothetical protein
MYFSRLDLFRLVFCNIPRNFQPRPLHEIFVTWEELFSDFLCRNKRGWGEGIKEGIERSGTLLLGLPLAVNDLESYSVTVDE